MANFFEKVASDVDNVEESMLGPDYEYYKQIRSPGELGVSGDGNMGAMAKDVGAIVNYVDLLVGGGGAASRTGKPLGSKFFLKTAGKCQDVKTKKIVDRSIYIDNVPDGSIPFISSMLDTNFSEFRGLVPGILEDTGAMNPMNLFSGFMQGATPPCREVTYPVVGDDRKNAPKSGYVALSEIKAYENEKNRMEAFVSGNQILRGEKPKRKKKKVMKYKNKNFAHMYTTGFGLLLVYLLYKVMQKK